MKKIFVLFLVLVMILSLAACGSKSEAGSRMIFDHEDAGEHVEPASKVNVQKVYDTMTYTEQMFYGWYELYGQSEEEFLAGMDIMTVNYCGEEKNLTVLPYEWRAGAGTISHKIYQHEEHAWAQFYFLTESGYLDFLLCAYEVEGKTLCIYLLTDYNYDEATDTVTYALAEEPLRYDFSFAGPNVTLSAGGKSVTVRARDFCEDHALVLDNYLTAGSACLDGIESMDLYACDTKESYERFTLKLNSDETVYNTTGYVTEEGLFSYSWTDAEGKLCNGQYVYFWCGEDGLVLTDGTVNYYYNDSHWAHYQNLLQVNVDEEDLKQFELLTESTLEQLEVKRTNLFEDLSTAFVEAGLNIRVDAQSGEIMLDSAVLFDTNSAELKEEGRNFLNAFLEVYTSVLFGEEYNGFVKKVVVEGHADPRGTYETNQTLSEDRAASVMNWCASEDNGLPAEHRSVLTGNMESVGYSSDYPVYDENGNVDNDASRRVSFRFIINIG